MFRFWRKKEKKEKLEILKRSALLDSYETQFKKIVWMLNNLNRKVDEIKEILEKRRISESPKILKTKERIISILKEKKSISSSQLGKLIGLSRTRCNEYLKKLEEEGLVKSIRVGKKKVYRLVDFV